MLNVKKLANAFVPNATPSDIVLFIVPSAVLSVIRGYKQEHGGLWVGGTVSVSEAGVSFAPNRLNRACHDGLQAIDVPARDIRAVRHEFGWVTGIVIVDHVHGEFRFRCYGAKRLAKLMSEVFRAS